MAVNQNILNEYYNFYNLRVERHNNFLKPQHCTITSQQLTNDGALICLVLLNFTSIDVSERCLEYGHLIFMFVVPDKS